ncbi:hypothetical protein [Nonomuraea endophytica]|uniref:Recombinase RecT n=1 Tax=Nonomuraea endophytica TaxID=714136 RepID=A0A7W8A9W9_9ACTN|nr:hypothetical protein [Nonomuraea endophytica]MBB5081320.1 hypothetical protein [Nonomuraea endophytica]
MTTETLPAVIRREDTLVERQEYAKALAVSDLLPAQYRNKPGNVLYAVEFGRSLGISPMAAILGVHIIEGRACASSGLISALVRDAGHRLRIWVERNPQNGALVKAVATIVRGDDPDFEFRAEWTWDRAVAAGVTGKKVWQNYREGMLKARAITEVAREACEEALRGVGYTPEELGAEVNEDGSIVITDARTPQGQSLGDALGVNPGHGDDSQDTDKASKKQRNEIGAAMVAQGYTKETAPGFLSKVAQRPVQKSEELTGAEAAQVMHALNMAAKAQTAPEAQPESEPQAAADDDIHEGELVDDEEPHEAEPVVMISKGQQAEMHALLKDCEITSATGAGSKAINDEKRFTYLSHFLNRPITSSSELTYEEAQGVVAALRQLRAEIEAERNLQLSQIGGLFQGLGVESKEDRLRDTSALLGRTITKPDELSSADLATLLQGLNAAGGVIDAWTALIAQVEAARGEDGQH